MSNWKASKLGDISQMCLGKMLDKDKNKGELQPYLANINVRWGSFDFINLNKMRFEKSESERYGLKFGDLVICEGGEPGRCAIWKGEIPEMKIQKALHRVRINDNYSNQFVYYRFLLAGRTGQLKNHFIGSTIKHLTGIGLKQVEFAFPSLNDQQKIATVLSVLDSKIEINNRINTELEAMAKTLYDYWFVQFDFPNKDGKPYKTSGGKMVWNEELKRDIPEGWDVKTIGEVAKIKAGGDRPSIYSVIKTDCCPIPIYSNGVTNGGLYGYTNEATINSQSVTISARGTIGYSVLRNKPFVPIIRLIVITPHVLGTAKYFDGFIKKIDFEKSGSVQQQLTSPQVSQLNILYPPTEILKSFEMATSSGVSQIETLTAQNQTLAELRDWLLPMLMNGQVQVTPSH